MENNTSSSAHTKTPWICTRLDRDWQAIENFRILASDGKSVIAHVFSEADARLFMAAPDLLNACITALDEGDDLLAIRTLKAAIAKAQG